MIQGLNHITLAVSNLDYSFQFYHDILKLKPLCRWHQGAYFLAGETWICLSLDNNVSYPLANIPYTHYAFTVTQQDFFKIKQQLLDAKVQSFKENTSEGDSIYFCDPDGHKLEIHVGNWQTRLMAKKLNPGHWQDVQFFPY